MPVKSYAAQLAAEQAARQKLEQAALASREKLDYAAQLEAQSLAERAAREHEMQLFDARVQRSRAAGRQIAPGTIPTLDQVWEQKRAQEAAEAEAAEQARIAAIPPEQLKRTTLSWSERQRRDAWERINGIPFPE